MTLRIEQQCHGYKSGHQLLGGSIKLSRDDQDAVDRLSDMSGPLRPGEQFVPYLTCYPLPSGSHYVVARTWQDLGTKRAGCVLTRSLFIQSTDWVDLADINSLFELLRPVDRDELAIEPLSFIPSCRSIPSVDIVQGIELVESLFLEERQSVVVFGSQTAELMIVRLLTALWPSLRRGFAACSFALAPRSIAGRSFDLMFASPDARSRFSRWSGRRIDGTAERNRDSRHRWSIATAKLVFEDSQPSLAKIDSLGILRDDSSGDETRLRLALLWNDLVEQSKRSPRAVLGMLDILQSRADQVYLKSPDLSLLVTNSVSLSEQLPVAEKLEFLVALTGKFKSGGIPLRLSIRVFEILRKAAALEPSAALEFLSSTEGILSSIPALVLAALGDGFAMSPRSLAFELRWNVLSDEALLKLFAASKSFTSLILELERHQASSAWLYRIPNVLKFPEARLSRKATGNLLRHLSSPNEAPILASCISGNDARGIEHAVRILWRSTQLSVSDFDHVFVECASSVPALIALKSIVLSLPETENTERFLLSTLNPNVEDFRWLMLKAKVRYERRVSILSTLLGSATRHVVQAVARDLKLSSSIVDDLRGASRADQLSERVAWLLIESEIPSDRLLKYVRDLLPGFSPDSRKELLESTVGRSLSSASHNSNAILLSLLSVDDFEMSTDHLVANAFTAKAGGPRLNDNLVLLNRAPNKVRRGILQYIDNLSERLVHIPIEGLGDDGVAAWSQLLSEAGEVNPIGQVRAASAVLSFAFAQPVKKVSPLIVVAFPIVYRALQDGREENSLFSFFFPDWDRCKTVRKDLARAFIHSQWPPEDLLMAATGAGDVPRILKAVLKEDSGQKYLRLLQNSVSRDSQFQKELKIALHGDDEND